MMACKESTKADSDCEWEETLMMVQVPSGAKLNTSSTDDMYLQVLGLWSEEPVIKLDNMMYSGKIKSTAGSHLFIELKDGDEKLSKSKSKSLEDRTILVADKSLQLHPVDLVRKKDEMEEA